MLTWWVYASDPDVRCHYCRTCLHRMLAFWVPAEKHYYCHTSCWHSKLTVPDGVIPKGIEKDQKTWRPKNAKKYRSDKIAKYKVLDDDPTAQ